ncbi:hypothetical protein CC1G_10721 [Coprinopsis cinerea okayama7|uniref:3'-5' exonuclease domain-containing protein n=1 Tax=Coprinopsis cinerea (strain Okayama-7 / 130 / ATCC MYA-4618 / FGSC 9003) TaxID=240176 RepID=A8NBE0_COPC7|nr:hypothetical protein CC1G_10721 [Coprinopsis cinerea okayama7\|eukprot:XP_001832139.2 hypothetical protein CC1G_10721 [Coprinopsis cinerea okayama7\
MSTVMSSQQGCIIRVADTVEKVEECIVDLTSTLAPAAQVLGNIAGADIPLSTSSTALGAPSSASATRVGSTTTHPAPIPNASTTHVPTIAVDLEGVKLNRYGRVCIVQMKLDVSNTVWLLDVTTLGSIAFDHADGEGRSVRWILQHPGIKKILELAVRHSNKRPTRNLNGLARSIESYLSPSPQWKQVKDAGIKLFSPPHGSYEVFEQRPLDERIMVYCAQDVTLLGVLEVVLRRWLGRFGSGWDQRVVRASEARLEEAKGSVLLVGRERAVSPQI